MFVRETRQVRGDLKLPKGILNLYIMFISTQLLFILLVGVFL